MTKLAPNVRLVAEKAREKYTLHPFDGASTISWQTLQRQECTNCNCGRKNCKPDGYTLHLASQVAYFNRINNVAGYAARSVKSGEETGSNDLEEWSVLRCKRELCENPEL